jgi:DNA polymerase-3 subunit alpha
MLWAIWKALYSKWPRIDKELILKYHKGLNCYHLLHWCIGTAGYIKGNSEAAETEFKWWLDLFGEDYYIELQRHDIPEQTSLIMYCLPMLKSIM